MQYKVIPIEAGSTKNITSESLNKFVSSSRSMIIRLNSGEYIHSKDYIRIRIFGSCMKPRNIIKGEEWLVKPIDKNKDVWNQIKPEDVLLIHIKDKDIYKIREYVSPADDENLNTIWYEADGGKHRSSRPHSIESIVGVVKYAIS